jgi:hypothetical protein
VIDTNGDRILEMTVFGRYYEGAWSTAYRINGTKVEKVLSCGCGA